MPQTLTKLGIWNLALDIVKETPLLSAQDQGAPARWLERNWAHTVEVLLRSYVWNFAKELRSLSADTVTPEHTWSYQYKMPPGTLRVLPINRYGQRRGQPVEHEIVGQLIMTNEPAPLKVRLIKNIANPGEFDPLFVEMLRCSLAMGLATKFPSKAKYIELARQLFTDAKEQAELIDAFEGSLEPTEEFDIIRARGSNENLTRVIR